MLRRRVRLIRLVFQKDVKDSRKQSASDGDSGFLNTAAFLQDLVLCKELRAAFGAWVAGGDGALDQKRLDILTRFANARSFLLSGAFIVLRGETRPRTKLLGRFELRHLDANFCDDTDWVIGFEIPGTVSRSSI